MTMYRPDTNSHVVFRRTNCLT